MSNIDKAVMFAFKAHQGQVRKGGDQPYIFHPLEVLSLVSQMTLDDDVLCAAVLHDTVEDTDVTITEIKKNFGDRVAKLVYYESEDKRANMKPEDSWKIRKTETITIVKSIDDLGAKMVCLADKISNLRSFHLLKIKEKDEMWKHFHMQDPKMHYWYYLSLWNALSDLEEYPLYKEMKFLIDAIFEE